MRVSGGGMNTIPVVVEGIIDNLRRVIQVVNEHSKKVEHKTGLTGPQLWAVKIISECSPLKVSDLARKMYLHPATVVGILDRLETRTLVERVRSKKDRRVVEVKLTEQGVQMVENSPEVAQGLFMAGLESLPERKLGKIAESLKQLVKILDSQKSPVKSIIPQELSPSEGA